MSPFRVRLRIIKGTVTGAAGTESAPPGAAADVNAARVGERDVVVGAARRV